MPRFTRIPIASTSANTSLFSTSPSTTPTSERSVFHFTSSPSHSASPPSTSTTTSFAAGFGDEAERGGDVVVIKVSRAPAATEEEANPKHLEEVKLLILPSSPVPPLFAVSSRAAALLSLPSIDPSKGEELVLSLVEREARWSGDEPERVEMSEESWGLYGWRKARWRSRGMEPVRVEVGVRRKEKEEEENGDKGSNGSKNGSGVWLE